MWAMHAEFEDLRGKSFWLGGVAGGAVTVTWKQSEQLYLA